eukprot:CAMPEP_0173350390 /NCGR_PEP_ID=MMETSP1144-20121109/14844_1 /TAXON_ID=483371 /ORGANISM="non described non described, Strain CCMP2298" /LENGTH=261 /DNA_ID=CAMNT_0014298305 /DNA_START=383 /DNA_END=1169 /DNA_ORIENTATION=-
MKPMVSAVAFSAAMMKSPSFSLSASSTTITTLPAATAATAASTDARPNAYPSPTCAGTVAPPRVVNSLLSTPIVKSFFVCCRVAASSSGLGGPGPRTAGAASCPSSSSSSAALVKGSAGDLDRHALGDRDTLFAQLLDFVGVVGQQPDGADVKIEQDVRNCVVLAQLLQEAQVRVGVHSVHAPVLQPVRSHLVDDADAAPLLLQVYDDASLLLDEVQAKIQLLPTVAPPAAKHLASEALVVHTHQHVLLSANISANHNYGF